jgi:hypothetical protein
VFVIKWRARSAELWNDGFTVLFLGATSADVAKLLRFWSSPYAEEPMKTDWKRKLLALLHDPPSKAVEVHTHARHVETLLRQAGFTDEEARRFGDEFARPSDWTASAADRLPFPKGREAGLSCAFDGVRNAFVHPLGPKSPEDGALRVPFIGPFLSVEAMREIDQTIQPSLAPEELDRLRLDEDHAWRARFFAHWRFWHRNAVEHDYRFGLLPADTRLPDHTVWTHMQITAALQTCAEGIGRDATLHPAFLKFQVGPVQEFIAAARSTRDLWSGSYLLSWLMAAGLKALSAEIGPDAVIYPSLRNQPLFDLHWRAELWGQVRFGHKTAWESLGYERGDGRALLTPNLPNVLLAVVPAQRAAELGKSVETAIRAEWKRIAGSVWDCCDKEGLTADEGEHFTRAIRRERFYAQIGKLLSLTWQATPWPSTLHEAMALAGPFSPGMPIRQAEQRVRQLVALAEKQMPREHRDPRYFVRDERGQIAEDASGRATLNNLGLGWSVILALNAWQLDAVRQTRAFSGWTSGGWQTGASSNKDSLTGREEAVAGGSVWRQRCEKLGGRWRSLFKNDDWIGAATLVKRLWHLAYLARAPWNLGAGPDHFSMPNTRGVAAHEPDKDCGDDETAEAAPAEDRYFAVLAFDGDEIGKWVSGEKTPRFTTQLAAYTDGSGNPQGAKPYYADPANAQQALLEAQRPLSPSYHLQFSEALSNFALFCAPPIVEAFDGRLIYAGGDDVLALLPADAALDCAAALQLAFTGSADLKDLLRAKASKLVEARGRKSRHVPSYQRAAAEGRLLDCPTDAKGQPSPGFICRLDRESDQNQKPLVWIVPGPRASASAGIAVAHFKSPLQDVVRAAQLAAKRAKRAPLARSAVAITLFKRSGETIEWGCKWESGGLELYRAVSDAMAGGELSSKFPHRVVELLSPYLIRPAALSAAETAADFGARAPEIIAREFGVAVERQRGSSGRPRLITPPLAGLLKRYLAQHETAEQKLQAVIGLCQTVAFANRTAEPVTAASQPAADRQPALV